MRFLLASLIELAVAGSHTASGQPVGCAMQAVATFRSGVDLVTVSAVVRDGKGRMVRDLGQSDFGLLGGGELRETAGFRAEPTPVSVALLFDASGSMQVAASIEKAQAAARYVLAVPGRGGSSERRQRCLIMGDSVTPGDGRPLPIWTIVSRVLNPTS